MRARIRYNTKDPVIVEIEDVVLKDNMENFLMQLCDGIGEEVLGLMSGEDFGLGRMKLGSDKVAIRWYDYPLTLFFHCDTVEIAETLKEKLNIYLKVPVEE